MRMRVLMLTMFMATALAAQGTIYQWTDKNGQVHYSDRPPPSGTQALEMSLQPMPATGTVEASGDSKLSADEDAQQIAERVQQFNSELDQRRRQATSREELRLIECELAQNVIDDLSSGSQATIASADGSVRTISEAERLDRIQTSQRFIDQYCAGA